MDKVYFPGLNGIRAIAVTVVILGHIGLACNDFNLPQLGVLNNGMSKFGVVLFFVLSGFLITFLLLSEKKKFGFLDYRKFYMRRILRIWPLYYFVLFLALFLNWKYNIVPVGHSHIPAMVLLFSFFLPNVSLFMDYGFATINPLWSVGVEEQFYSFWPLVISKSKNYVRSFLIIILTYLIALFTARFFQKGDTDSIIYKVITYSSFDCMAIGGIGAVWFFSNQNI